MLKTHGSNRKLKKIVGKLKFTELKKGLTQTVSAYKLFGI